MTVKRLNECATARRSAAPDVHGWTGTQVPPRSGSALLVPLLCVIGQDLQGSWPGGILPLEMTSGNE